MNSLIPRKAVVLLLWSAFQAQAQLSPDGVARLLAGMPSRESSQLTSDPVWREHAQRLDLAWAKVGPRLRYIQAWAMREVPQCSSVFYPFSGPDYLYAQAIFPMASSYVLCGLEPVGQLPDEVTAQILADTSRSLDTLFKAGYFVTKEMSTQLKGCGGALPLLCVLLVRSGSMVISVTRERGHVQINYLGPGKTGLRALHYYCTDLARPGAVQVPTGSGVYIKSASYLLHSDEFASLRAAMLERSKVIVQDDSGIPFKYFDRIRWDLRAYGRYTAPLNIFREHYQADLAEYFEKSPIRTLGFGSGYKWNPKEACMIIAIRQ